jgi:hypothetical protein
MHKDNQLKMHAHGLQKKKAECPWLARAARKANIKGYAWQSRTKIASMPYAMAKFAKNLYALSLGTEGVTDKYLANIFHEGLACISCNIFVALEIML